ncbi:MAG: UDP-N-acetyl-D-mannosaminuronic acid dehydrogenase, partial [Actinomycetota bacterium]
MPFDVDLVIVGGCGRVGLPLGLAFADRGLTVGLYDVNEHAVGVVNAGQMPFQEDGAEDVLARVGNELLVMTDPSLVSRAEHVLVVIGTPVDEHLDPRPTAVPDAIEALAPHLRDGQLLVLRSTLYPGVTAMVEQLIARLGLKIDVAFCPERIAEGAALTELFDLPQIVAGRTASAQARAEKLFGALTASTVALSPEEAELAQLFT